jgi:hypothetical protein
MASKHMYRLSGLILSILWAVAQFLLLDQIAIGLGADNFLRHLTHLDLKGNVHRILKRLGVRVDPYYVPLNFYSMATMFLLIVIAIAVNFITGLLQLSGVDAVLTAIVNGTLGSSFTNQIMTLFKYVVFIGQGLLNLQIINYMNAGIPYVGSSHRICSKMLPHDTVGRIFVGILEVLGIMNIFRLLLATKVGDYVDANNIIYRGIFSAIETPLLEIPAPGFYKVPKLNSHTDVNPYGSEMTILNVVRQAILTILGTIFASVQFATGLPIPPLIMVPTCPNM